MGDGEGGVDERERLKSIWGDSSHRRPEGDAHDVGDWGRDEVRDVSQRGEVNQAHFLHLGKIGTVLYNHSVVAFWHFE